MGLSFMSRYGGRFADRAMLRDAVRQVGLFHHYLWNPATELLYQLQQAGAAIDGCALNIEECVETLEGLAASQQ